jgi:glycosyltransferase involved in cell wall biosynthesis
MEAMASGLPCVVSRIRGNTDLIEEGQGGFLCSPKDSAAFTAAISRLVDDADLREKMSRHNLERIKDFDTSVVIEQMTKIYQEIFEEKEV